MVTVVIIIALIAGLYHGTAAAYRRLSTRPDKADRLRKFRVVVIARLVAFLGAAYIVVSKVAVSPYQCQELGPLGSYLKADYRIKCFTPSHYRRMRLGAMGILAYPVGIPLFYYGLLLANDVPRFVRQKVDDAWLRAVVAHSHSIGLVPPRRPPDAPRRRCFPSPWVLTPAFCNKTRL